MWQGIVLFLVKLLHSVLSNECQGQCVQQRSCQSFLEGKKELSSLKEGSFEYKQKLLDLKSQICNRKNKTVCCSLETTTPPDSPSWLPTLGGSDCGIGYEHLSFIIGVGGTQTSLGEFPWTVLLGKKSRRTGNIVWHCGGTLINRWYILTAAHCGPRIEMVRIGEWEVKDKPDLNQRSERVRGNHSDCFCRDNSGEVPTFCGSERNRCAPQPQDILVEDVKTHSGYRRSTLSGIEVNDIALVKLKTPVQYNEFSKPICLPSDRELERIKRFGELGKQNLLSYGKPIVVGWGKTYTDADDEIEIVATPIQQKVVLPVVSNKECGDTYSDLFRKNVRGEIRLAEHLCAGGERGKDSCKGDSGGPLIGRDKDKPFQLVGIVSSGTRICGIGAPGIFTRVTTYMTWIKRNLV